MKLALQTRDRRALILLACAVGLYFLVADLLLPAYDDLRAGEAAALQKEDQLLRYRRTLARAADYEVLLEEARRRIEEGEAQLISGDNVPLASAQLQMLVESAAERTGIELGQRNMSAARPVDEYFSEIGMSLAFQSTPEQLVRFLQDIRSAEQLLAVRSIQVSPLQGADGVVPLGEMAKDLSVNVTFGAVLAAPAGAATGEDPDEG